MEVIRIGKLELRLPDAQIGMSSLEQDTKTLGRLGGQVIGDNRLAKSRGRLNGQPRIADKCKWE